MSKQKAIVEKENEDKNEMEYEYIPFYKMVEGNYVINGIYERTNTRTGKDFFVLLLENKDGAYKTTIGYNTIAGKKLQVISDVFYDEINNDVVYTIKIKTKSFMKEGKKVEYRTISVF